MGRMKIDIKIRLLMEKCVVSHQRSLFCVIGPKARDQVVILHHMLVKARSNEVQKPSILWCFTKDNGYSFICHKKQRLLKKKYSGNYSFTEDDCFDHFLASSNINFCHYNDTASVLGQTFGLLVIQDFYAITPNILSRIVECVEGSGMIILLVSNVQSVEEIASLKMDVHSRYATFAHSHIDPVFNTRFMLSLLHCENCMVLDDSLKILLCPSRSDPLSTQQLPVKNKLVNKLQCDKTDSTDILNRISLLCYTTDQAKALELFINTLKGKCTNSIVSLISARGRGKSAALGLTASCALYFKYSSIYVTSPQLENIQTLFSFVVKGMNTFELREGKDYNILYCTDENKKLITGINIFHDHKQRIKYLNPTEYPKVGISDLVIIDEAAAIPLPVVRSWLKSNIIFMASTINGYEGTGRSLSLKLLSQLRELSLQRIDPVNEGLSSVSDKVFELKEIELNEAIRYADGDHVENWLNNLYCLSSEITFFTGDMPDPESCELYYVNRKFLFSYQNIAEKFLQQLVALFVSSHYKNSPNDLLMMADAPSHHIFCLVAPADKHACCLPNVLCVIQVALEGKIPKECVIQELAHGKRASGDLIPWTISQQFQDDNFPVLSGARIVRVATHPNYQRMGYGKKALQLLFSYYAKEPQTDSHCTQAQNERSSLLLNLVELQPEPLDYIGVSYGLTIELLSVDMITLVTDNLSMRCCSKVNISTNLILNSKSNFIKFKFWKKLEFVPVYIRQTASETTGEHSCIMIKAFKKSSWFPVFLSDFLERFTTFLTTAFRNLPATLALDILHYKRIRHQTVSDSVSINYMQSLITDRSMKRLEAYCNHQVDYHLIMDLMPVLAKLYFMNYFKDFFLSLVQETILLCMGLQNKSVEELSQELNMETNQVMGLFMKTVKKILYHLAHIHKNGKQDKNLQNSKQCSDKTQNSSEKDLSFKRKQEDFNYGERKKRHKKTLS